MQSKEYLCEDCNENYISKARYEQYGICLSCQRRKIFCNTMNKPYIRYVDLSDEEKAQVIKTREKNNKYIAKNRAKKSAINMNVKNKVDSQPSEIIIGTFLEKYKYNDLSSLCIKLDDMYEKFTEYCHKYKCSIISSDKFSSIIQNKFNYQIVKNENEIYILKGNINARILEKIDKEEIKPKKSLRERIYTPEIIEEIKLVANENTSINQLKAIFVQRYPELNITYGNLANIITRHKIPHCRGYVTGLRDKTENELEKIDVVNEVQDEKSNIIESSESNALKNEEDISEKHILEKEVDEDGDPVRLVPIKEEVVSILDEKFKEKKCRNQFNYSVDDYINMLEMFEYLACNIDGLIKCRDSQFNIINNYQFDIIHEMENELAEEGNTYLQDKMYVMRDYRRYMEIDYKALKQLKPILKLIKTAIHPSNPNNATDTKSISGCINSLKQIISENAQPKFIPRVDVDMTKKYDWAVNRNSTYKRAVTNAMSNSNITEAEQFIQNNIVAENITKLHKEEDSDLAEQLKTIDKQVTDNKPFGNGVQIQDKNIKINESLKNIKSNINLTNDEIKRGFAIYRVSCRISGGGFGVFKPWYKDYTCINEEMAKAMANQEIARLKNKNSQILISEIACHKLNVV